MKTMKEIIRQINKESSLESEAYYTIEDLAKAIKLAREDLEEKEE